MKPALLELLVDPTSGGSLRLEITESAEDELHEGTLYGSIDDVRYPLHNGIPRLVVTDDSGQIQTADAFGFKWQKRDTYDSPAVKSGATVWYLAKYGYASLEEWAQFYDSRQRILDVGCGSGFSSSLWLDTPYWSGRAMWVGADISLAVDVAQERVGHLPNTHFVQANALHLPFADGSFDTVFSEGVLHHTPSTRAALLASARVLGKGGEFHFYVYRRKGPLREFTDDYVRTAISSLSDEAAWDAMRSLTHLGQALAELHTQVRVEEDVPLLGIRAGEYDIQRLIYYQFAKLYWNSTFSFEENVHINFDWYRPQYAHRQSVDEVQAWCDEANLSVTRIFEDESGITVRAVKG